MHSPTLRDELVEEKLGAMAEREGSGAAHSAPRWPTYANLAQFILSG